MSKRILLVEDNLDSQIIISQIAIHLNHEIDVTASVEEAVTHLFETTTSYDLVMTDLRLPGENGWNLLRMIKENPKTAHITCIAVTGYSSIDVEQAAKQAGFAYFVPKPISAKLVVEIFNECLT